MNLEGPNSDLGLKKTYRGVFQTLVFVYVCLTWIFNLRMLAVIFSNDRARVRKCVSEKQLLGTLFSGILYIHDVDSIATNGPVCTEIYCK